MANVIMMNVFALQQIENAEKLTTDNIDSPSDLLPISMPATYSHRRAMPLYH